MPSDPTSSSVRIDCRPLVIAADDVVVRHLRVRLGDETGVQDDAVSITRGRRIILDHISASWSVDETLSAGSRYDPPERGIYDVTVQWSLIAESLNASNHAKGEHGYGSLVRGGFGARMTFRPLRVPQCQRGVCRYRQNWPHPFARRHTTDAGAGNIRLGGPAGPRRSPCPCSAAASV